ncbi:MAG: iron-sulfur cluster assembly protein, partial [Zoogloea sp.]|nr:iron-sulfur cluster assembly protein [Zoogloea sp.]
MFSFFRRTPATDTMSLTEQSVLDSLRHYADPNTGKDYVASRWVKNLRISGADVSFDI